MGEVLYLRDYQPKAKESLHDLYAELTDAQTMLHAAITSMTLSLTNLNEPITFPQDEPPTESA